MATLDRPRRGGFLPEKLRGGFPPGKRATAILGAALSLLPGPLVPGAPGPALAPGAPGARTVPVPALPGPAAELAPVDMGGA